MEIGERVGVEKRGWKLIFRGVLDVVAARGIFGRGCVACKHCNCMGDSNIQNITLPLIALSSRFNRTKICTLAMPICIYSSSTFIHVHCFLSGFPPFSNISTTICYIKTLPPFNSPFASTWTLHNLCIKPHDILLDSTTLLIITHDHGTIQISYIKFHAGLSHTTYSTCTRTHIKAVVAIYHHTRTLTTTASTSNLHVN